MTNIGIVEGFFGPTWSQQSRLEWAEFLQKYGGNFYIYAPKRDANLRKNWRDDWEEGYLSQLRSLRDVYQQKNLKFGVAISPFGLGSQIAQADWDHLENKFSQLADLKLDYLGLFFDDMPTTESLLSVQAAVVNLALQYFPSGLIFCPSYYTYDPILDKVFGPRPLGYMDGMKDVISPRAEICWTGPKVISEEISQAHLEEIKKLLGRKPFIWENLFANDGPKNCKFLKLKYFQGRDSSLNSLTSGLAFNLMNQPYLSQILFLSSLWVIKNNLTPSQAFEQAAHSLLSKELAALIIKQRETLLNEGLDKMTQEQKDQLSAQLGKFSEGAAQEIKTWLAGDYLVGPECLTD